jgi:radical SAM protein with 4Fe4S-binding SPASM domain
MSIETSTNANLDLPAEDIVNSGMDILEIPIDGMTQETYSEYRKNGSLEKVLNNVRNIIKVKKEQGKSCPEIVCKFIVFKHNEHEIERFKALCDELGDVTCKIIPAIKFHQKDDLSLFSDNPDLATNHHIQDKEIINHCHSVWRRININCDGEINVCCFDRDNQVKIGNIKYTGIKELWNSNKFMNFRKTLLQNRKQYGMCCICQDGDKFY